MAEREPSVCPYCTVSVPMTAAEWAAHVDACARIAEAERRLAGTA